jgi:hypothetical protein
VKSFQPDHTASRVANHSRRSRRRHCAEDLALAVLVLAAGCAGGSRNWFSPGPRPLEIAGVWIDVALSSPSDTVAWILAPSGSNRTSHISVGQDSRGVPSTVAHEKSNGLWYLSGRLGDTTTQAICYKRRARDGGTCLRFQMDTVSGPRLLRRLRVFSYSGDHRNGARVFLERR